MTYWCSECQMSWAAYQALGGQCPLCKSGTKRTSDQISDDADELFRTIKRLEKEDQEREERRQAFHEFYVLWNETHSYEEWRATTPDLS